MRIRIQKMINQTIPIKFDKLNKTTHHLILKIVKDNNLKKKTGRREIVYGTSTVTNEQI
jgi:hypothetical protein